MAVAESQKVREGVGGSSGGREVDTFSILSVLAWHSHKMASSNCTLYFLLAASSTMLT